MGINFKELGTNVAGGLLNGASGPLADLVQNKHAFQSYSFPSDVEGVGQRHFIRFNIANFNPAIFDTKGKNTEVAETDATGEVLGGLIGASIGDAVGNGLAGGIAAQAATSVIDEIGLQGKVDKALADFKGSSLFSEISESVSGISQDIGQSFGKIKANAAEMKKSIVETVPITEDALNGIGNFVGSIGGMAEKFSSATGGEKESVADIILFMPFDVSESYQLTWNAGGLGLLGAFVDAAGGMDGLQNIIKQSAAGNVDDALENIMSNIKPSDAVGAVSEGLGNIAGAKLGMDVIKQKLLKLQGKSINPYWELFFDGIQPRTFSFNFQLAPKNATEAEAINQIVRAFKAYAAPSISTPSVDLFGKKIADAEADSSRYWGYPSLFEIEYWNSQKLHKLKPCALTGINVNYSGSGTNHTFYDGNPIQTNITLNFAESELITREQIVDGY